MRTQRYAKSGAYGRDRGGIPMLIEKPNRAMRRLIAKQAGNEKGRQHAPNSKQLMTNESVRKS